MVSKSSQNVVELETGRRDRSKSSLVVYLAIIERYVMRGKMEKPLEDPFNSFLKFEIFDPFVFDLFLNSASNEPMIIFSRFWLF